MPDGKPKPMRLAADRLQHIASFQMHLFVQRSTDHLRLGTTSPQPLTNVVALQVCINDLPCSVCNATGIISGPAHQHG